MPLSLKSTDVSRISGFARTYCLHERANRMKVFQAFQVLRLLEDAYQEFYVFLLVSFLALCCIQ